MTPIYLISHYFDSLKLCQMWEQFLKKDLSQKQEASESSPKEDGGQNHETQLS